LTPKVNGQHEQFCLHKIKKSVDCFICESNVAANTTRLICIIFPYRPYSKFIIF
jgi:hypothetical protein